MGVYRYSNGQIRLSDFKQPLGMHLKGDNRWMKKAQAISWREIGKRMQPCLPAERERGIPAVPGP